jgi:hypothetical protein
MSTIITARPPATNDFAWYAGEWDIANRRRNADGVWQEFAATGSVAMHVDGLVQLDHFDAPDFPGRGHVRAVTVRAWNPTTDQWSIIWLCNYADPDFDPMVGAWDGDEGHFFQSYEDERGEPMQARFRWTRFSDDHARWEQALSADGGATWDWNWAMEMVRRTPA